VRKKAIEGDVIPRRDESLGVAVNGGPLRKNAGVGGGAFEGADKLGRELMSWRPSTGMVDDSLSRDKPLLDARGADILRNNGQVVGAGRTQQNSIIGQEYRLNSQPMFEYLRLDEVWAEEFQIEVEQTFSLYAESQMNWIDVSRMSSFTDMIRMALGCFFAGGEVAATANWMTRTDRPFKTAMQMVNADRISNPNDTENTRSLRRGVRLGSEGDMLGVYLRRTHPNALFDWEDKFVWDYWPLRKRWGRGNFLYLVNRQKPDQHRGVADMASVLKETRMAKKFHETALQNAIVQASYAAAIESELPPDMAFESVGAMEGVDPRTAAALSYLGAIAEYSRGGRNLEIDGVKIPHLFPGTKLNLLPASSGTAGIGEALEASLHRFIAQGLGVSYEEYTGDYSKVNYSSFRAAANRTLQNAMALKRGVADWTANWFFRNWLEEAITENHLETTRHLTRKNPEFFYERMNAEALCRCTWIGASRGQVEELKETQAAILRINSGLSTYEIESARLGYDFRALFRQRAREESMKKKYGLVFEAQPTKPGTLSSQRGSAANDDAEDGEDDAAANA
jgi:lambda family phage portal protein